MIFLWRHHAYFNVFFSLHLRKYDTCYCISSQETMKYLQIRSYISPYFLCNNTLAIKNCTGSNKLAKITLHILCKKLQLLMRFQRGLYKMVVVFHFWEALELSFGHFAKTLGIDYCRELSLHFLKDRLASWQSHWIQHKYCKILGKRYTAALQYSSFSTRWW